ncbi:hypothetical protein ACU686_38440 [Yinghuangia aomiensis]
MTITIRRLREFLQRPAHVLRRAGPDPHADHREMVEADGQRIGDADDLEDAVVLQPRCTR